MHHKAKAKKPSPPNEHPPPRRTNTASALPFFMGPPTTCPSQCPHHVPPCVTFRRVAVSLRGPGQSPVLPFACCARSLRSDGHCGLCSCWCRFRGGGAPSLVCRGCAGC